MAHDIIVSAQTKKGRGDRKAALKCDIKQKQNTKQTQYNAVLFRQTCGQPKTRARHTMQS